MRSLLVAVLLVLGALVAGCQHHHHHYVHVHHIKVETARGPDGSSGWRRISCPHLDKYCYSVARTKCPNGYVFTKSTPSPEPGGASVHDARTLPPQEQWGPSMYSDASGVLLIRCASSPTTI